MIFVKTVIFLSFSSFFSFAYLLVQEGANSETLEAYIFGCIGVRTVELATRVLWLLKFLQRKPWSSSSLVRATIRRLSQSLNDLLVDFKGQSLIYY